MRIAMLVGAGVALLTACSGEPTGEPLGPGDLPPPAPSRFVVFSEPALRIGELGVPVPAPVTVGSSPTPATLESNRPDVVGITPSGALVGYRAGRAQVRALGSGSTLEVYVDP